MHQSFLYFPLSINLIKPISLNCWSICLILASTLLFFGCFAFNTGTNLFTSDNEKTGLGIEAIQLKTSFCQGDRYFVSFVAFFTGRSSSSDSSILVKPFPLKSLTISIIVLMFSLSNWPFNSLDTNQHTIDVNRFLALSGLVGHGGVEPPYGAYKAPALTDELMAQNIR